MTLKKSEFIKKYGEVAWQKELEQAQEWKNAHRVEMNANRRKRSKETPEKIKANNQEANRKGGKYYNQKLKYMRTGIPGARNVIRSRHGKQYRPYKMIIAPESQIHHEWVPNTSEYKGVALVEKDQHMHGIVDVIEILDGEITLLTEEEVKRGKKKKNENRVTGHRRANEICKQEDGNAI